MSDQLVLTATPTPRRSVARRTLAASDKPAVLGMARTRCNGRYNGNGRTWATPPEVFEPLNAEFQFTLDPCAEPETAKCARYFTETDNGLARSWAGERVFMNPPYGREIYAWTRKAREEAARGALVVGLLPASTDLAWWHDDVVGADAEVRYLRGRVRFLTDGPYRASGFFASVVVVWRPRCDCARSASNGPSADPLPSAPVGTLLGRPPASEPRGQRDEGGTAAQQHCGGVA